MKVVVDWWKAPRPLHLWRLIPYDSECVESPTWQNLVFTNVEYG